MGFIQFFYKNITLNLVSGGFQFGMSWGMVTCILAIILIWKAIKYRMTSSKSNTGKG